MRKYRARRTELGRELNRSKGSRNEESGKGRMDSGHKKRGRQSGDRSIRRKEVETPEANMEWR